MATPEDEQMDYEDPGCGFYRLTPREHRCVEGACYLGDTEETRAFGNCCAFCAKADTCEGRCAWMDETEHEEDKPDAFEGFSDDPNIVEEGICLNCGNPYKKDIGQSNTSMTGYCMSCGFNP